MEGTRNWISSGTSVRILNLCSAFMIKIFFTLFSVRNASTTFSRHFSATASGGSGDTGTSTYDDNSDSLSSRSESTNNATIIDDASPRTISTMLNSSALDSSMSLSISSSVSGDDLRRVTLRSRSKIPKTQVVIVTGPPGWVNVLSWSKLIHACPIRIGKSSMILANQAKWRCEYHSRLIAQ